MSATKRADVLTRLQKVLAKNYKPVKPIERPVLEQLLYAACLEDTKNEIADECFARLQESFFDWNEVRVTTVHELSETMRGTHNQRASATTVKQVLHSVFESIYEFDLEPLKKQNLGAAVKQLQQLKGTTAFSVGYVTQNCLGGHAIPLSHSALEIMEILGVVNERERESGTVPGLERAVPKTKGVEFGSLLHQLAADYATSPFGTQVRALLVEVEPSAKDRLPKRGAKKPVEAEPPAKPAKKKSVPKAESKTAAKATSKKSAPAPKKTVAKKSTTKKVVKKKAGEKRPPQKAKPKKGKSSSITKKATSGAKKSASKQLARRKPR